MHRLVYVLCLVVSLPISAHATSNISNASCSSGLTSELVNGASFACACTSSNTVIQNTSNKILNWSEFNIEQSATVSFNQGQSSNAIVNRVLGLNQTPSGVVTVVGGGDIIDWSSTGDIDAGKGSKTATSAPLPLIRTDSSGNTLVDFSGVVSGSGIGTLQTLPTVPGGSIVISSGSGSGLGGLVTTGNNTYKPPISLSAVPEPNTYLMLLLGLGFITYRRQFKR